MTERPKYHDKRIPEMVAEKLLPKVLEYLRQNSGADEEDVRKDLRDALRHGDDDGFTLCYNLKRDCHWDPDSELVEIMDEAGYFRNKSHDELVQQWVAEEKIVLSLPVGATVRVTTRRKFRQPEEEFDGVVTTLLPETARYVIRIPALGHVEEGIGKTGTTGQYFDKEDVER